MSVSLLVDGSSSADPQTRRPAPTQPFQARFLALQDIPSLLRLEARQWSPEQAADEPSLRQRILTYPGLCVGSFCSHTGEAVSSLFMRPIHRDDLGRMRQWADVADLGSATFESTRSLLGISLTSVDPRGAWGMIQFFWPHALKQGWRDIYLGSPIPGLKQAMLSDPQLTVQHYVLQRKRGLPRDPQLRYYHRMGFRHLVALKSDYFPHPSSLNYGVLLRGVIPLAWLWPLWRLLPWSALRSMSRTVEGVL
ncbi:MAG: hypothetical protein JF606_18080 [Burkholderiales bacterium]|nr:hypothetical protein [Burkholderiales bacterium]